MTSATIYSSESHPVRETAAEKEAGPHAKNRKPRWRRCAVYSAAGIAVVLLSKLMAYAPGQLERFYVNGVGAWIAKALSTVSRVAPFSIAEFLILLFGCWLIVPAFPAIHGVIARRRAFGNALLCGMVRTAGAVGILVTVFYVFWGFNYSRAALPARLAWDDTGLAALPRIGTPEDRDELVALCAQLVFITNHYYDEALGTRDAMARSEPTISDAELDRSLDAGFVRAAQLLNLDATFAAPRGPAKAIFASRIMSVLGIAGFYSPWTGEANYNRETPPFQRPQTIAHEKAHQRCVASEDEANFFGFLACVLSDEPYARYGGYLFAQRQLLMELVKLDPAAARDIIALRCKGVQSDVYYGRFFSRIFRGPVQSLSHAVNDAYLKANRVDGGMLSYQMSARLLVLFARNNGGTCVATHD